MSRVITAAMLLGLVAQVDPLSQQDPVGTGSKEQEFAIFRCDDLTGSRVTLSIIVVDTKAEAERVLSMLKTGESFASIARQYSVHPSGAAGGSLGQMSITDLRSDIQAAVRGLPVGGLSGMVAQPKSPVRRPRARAPLTAGDVLRLIGVRRSDEEVIRAIDGAETVSFWLNPTDIANLRAKEVSEAVIEAMKAKFRTAPAPTYVAFGISHEQADGTFSTRVEGILTRRQIGRGRVQTIFRYLPAGLNPVHQEDERMPRAFYLVPFGVDLYEVSEVGIGGWVLDQTANRFLEFPKAAYVCSIPRGARAVYLGSFRLSRTTEQDPTQPGWIDRFGGSLITDTYTTTILSENDDVYDRLRTAVEIASAVELVRAVDCAWFS